MDRLDFLKNVSPSYQNIVNHFDEIMGVYSLPYVTEACQDCDSDESFRCKVTVSDNTRFKSVIDDLNGSVVSYNEKFSVVCTEENKCNAYLLTFKKTHPV